jgi:NADH dehydrogenase
VNDDPETTVRARGGEGAQRPVVVVVGGGFAGLHAVKSLRGLAVDVTLVDQRNHHLFQPLLYQVATAGLSAPDIAVPIRAVFRKRSDVRVLLAEAVGVDLACRRLELADGEVAYDYLILATGATHNYFGHETWKAHAPGLKTIEDALQIRRRLLMAFEAAERDVSPATRRNLLTFVIVGAGPTGVELAGAVREIAVETLARDFRSFDPREARVVLLDASDQILPTFSPKSSACAERLLEDRLVEVLTGRMVTAIDSNGVSFGGERIEARTVFWAAGVQASHLGARLGCELDKAGCVRVRPDLSLPLHREVFVAGDLAAVEQDGLRVPGTAAAAIQQGRHAAEMIRADITGKERQPFRFRDRGMLATIGRRAAVGRIAGLEMSGLSAWILWLTVHLIQLVGFRNRLAVLFEWAWAYLTYQRSARVIIDCPDDWSGRGEASTGERSKP